MADQDSTFRRAIQRATQARIAEALHMDPAAFSRFVSGDKVKLGLDDVCALVNACNLDLHPRGLDTVTVERREFDALKLFAERGFDHYKRGTQ